MTLGPVNKIYKKKKNKTTSKKLDHDLMSANCNAIVISQFIGNLEESEIRILDV